MNTKRFLMMLLAMAVLVSAIAPEALASVPLLPFVSEEMTSPAFWTQDGGDADRPLLTIDEIREINQRIVETAACRMPDMRAEPEPLDPLSLRRAVWASAFDDAAGEMRSHYYDSEGHELSGTDLLGLLDSIGEAGEADTVRYGICVRRTDLRSLPGDAFATDEQGDLNFNYYQLYGVRVNEPLLVKAESRDGAYYYCDTECCSGWLPADCVAICADRGEWLNAWDIPNEEAIVVTDGKVWLESTNVNADTSEVMLTMGTVLRRITQEEYDPAVTGRAAIHNYPVWLPIRRYDGSYARVMALISQNENVSEGYLPLTTENILRVAFTMLGDTYGWGSMLNSADCSAYVRDVYRCFGLVLARNTTWQSAMPVYKVDVGAMEPEEKKALLDTLPAGTVLYFSGHEMMYLGESDGQYYVISAVSTVKDYESDNRLRLRSVSINSLDIKRMNGKSWLESLNLMLVPFLPPETGLKGWVQDSDALASLMQYVSDSVNEESEGYIPPEDRIAVFDFDGTLYGERFPTYFNDWLYINRALYDENYEAPEELKDFAEQWEGKVLNGTELPDFDEKERLYGPQLYEGLSLEEYREIVRRFKEEPVYGFEGMNYGEAFFRPMLSVVKYLYDNGYSIYVNSGTYREAVRTMMENTLDRYIPENHVIGTDLLLRASGQGETSGLDYTMQPEEELVIAGGLFVKNLKTNKVLAMQREIGKNPVLVFGNSSGDFAMANAAQQNTQYKGQAYMLLCDNTELDYGDLQTAESFSAKCAEAGYHTISMAEDFTTIYGDQVQKAEPAAEELAAA